MASEEEYDDDYDVPLHHKRPFGSGIQRTRVEFVKASSPELKTLHASTASTPGSSLGDMYLSIVLPEASKGTQDASLKSWSGSQIQDGLVCAVCNMPLDPESVDELERADESSTNRKKHEASIAHQVCLPHSHPPSALDRSRMGLSYLESYGWDPDSRKGLGAAGQGIQYPLKTKPKDDKLGLGLVIPKEIKNKIEKKKPERLDAKKCRQKADEDKRKAEKLRQMFYGSEDLDRYLGSG